jgi:hypothetical protein
MRKAVAALSVGALLGLPSVVQASSHREAPFVTKNPKVDGTDFYMFNSYETGRAGYVTILANYLPLQDAFGGPNYFSLDPDALYEIMIDNTGDGVEDITFQFQFHQTLANSGMGLTLNIGYPDGGSGQTVAVPFINLPTTTSTPTLNVLETYSVNVVTGPRRSGTVTAVTNAGGSTFTKPADFIGPKSYGAGIATGASAGGANPVTGAANYATYANQYIYGAAGNPAVTIPGCAASAGTPKIFVGQRADPFAVNLGPIFDLIDAPAAVITAGGTDFGAVGNPLAKKNVTTIAIEVPASCITSSASQTVIGGWTTASVRQARVVNPKATYPLPSFEGGAWTQVSRLGMPLVNEVVIGLPDKDLFNTSAPKDDAQFAKYVTNPTLPAAIDVIFGTGFQPQLFPRADLVQVFLTGVPDVNAFPVTDAGPAPVASEMLRLNTGIAATAPANQNRLGAALCFTGNPRVLDLNNTGCDKAGFPNGRRPIDDVVDLALDVVEGYLIPQAAPAYATTTTLFTDAVDQATPGVAVAGSPALWTFQNAFPYFAQPTAGANGNGS